MFLDNIALFLLSLGRLRLTYPHTMRHTTIISIVVLACTMHRAVGLCLSDNSSGFPLPTVVNSAGVEICPAGFHCPGFNPMDNATFPVYCVPTP
ncbi:Hypothetical protein, putative, partial [Bodo saltans]